MRSTHAGWRDRGALIDVVGSVLVLDRDASVLVVQLFRKKSFARRAGARRNPSRHSARLPRVGRWWPSWCLVTGRLACSIRALNDMAMRPALTCVPADRGALPWSAPTWRRVAAHGAELG